MPRLYGHKYSGNNHKSQKTDKELCLTVFRYYVNAVGLGTENFTEPAGLKNWLKNFASLPQVVRPLFQ